MIDFLDTVFGFDHTTNGIPATSMNSAATVSVMTELAARDAK